MGLNEENMRLRMRLNALKEQNDRLIGTVKVLEATNEQLTLKNEALEKLYKEFKDAFEDVFIRNVSDSWARVDDETKRTMKTQEKIYFFNREVNNTKIAIRDYLLDKLKSMEKEKDEQIAELQQRIEELERGINARANRQYESEKEDSPIVQNSVNLVSKKSDTNTEISPDDKATREAHKDAMSTKNGTTMFSSVFERNRQEKNSSISQKNELSSIEKITLTPVYTEFKEISKNKAVTENIRYIKIKETIDGMSEKEINKVFRPIIEKFSKEVAFDRQPVALLLLKLIGETGWYTIKDFNDELQKRFSEETNENERRKLSLVAGKAQIIKHYLTLLCNANLVERLDVPISGGKGRPSNPYVLTASGNLFYVIKYNDDPVKSLYVTMAKDQKSVEHAANIKKVLDILESNGYICTQEDRIDLPDGRSSICDILTQKNGHQFRVEVEDGNYNKQKYYEKYEKILFVDNWLIFIAPNAKVKEKLKEYFVDFINERIYNGMDGFKQAGKKNIFLSVAELQENPDIFYNEMLMEK